MGSIYKNSPCLRGGSGTAPSVFCQGRCPREERLRLRLGAEKEVRLRPLPASADFAQETVVLEYSAE